MSELTDSGDEPLMTDVEASLVRAVLDLSRACLSMADMLAQLGTAVPAVVTPEWTMTYRNALSASIQAFDEIDRFSGRHKAVSSE